MFQCNAKLVAIYQILLLTSHFNCSCQLCWNARYAFKRLFILCDEQKCLHYNKYVVSVFDRIFDRNELIYLECCEMIVGNVWISDRCGRRLREMVVGDDCGKRCCGFMSRLGLLVEGVWFFLVKDSRVT